MPGSGQAVDVEAHAVRRRLRATLHGGLIGAWWGLCVVLLVRGADRAFWLTSLEPARLERAFGFETTLLPMLAARAGLPFVPSLASIVLACFGAGLLAGYLVSACWDALHIDPQRQSGAAIGDVLSSGRVLALLVGVPVTATMVMGVLAREFLPIPAVIFWLAAPFFVLDRATLSGPTPTLLGRPAWPGGFAFATAIGIYLLAAAAGAATEFLGGLGGIAGTIVGEVASFGVDVIAACLFCAAWIDGIVWRELWRPDRPWWQRETMLAFLALYLRLVVAALWVLPPILCVTVSSIWFLPQIQSLLESEGHSLPAWIGILSRSVSDAYIFALLLMPLVLAMQGRLYVTVVTKK